LPTGTTTVESNDAGGLFADNECQLEEPCPLAQRRLNPMTREDSSLTTNVNILDGKPEDPNDPVKTTLVIVPPSLLNQWMTEMVKHVEGNRLGRILRYHSGARLTSNDVVADLMSYDIILTTYNEIRKSFPMAEPPKHLCTEAKKNEWWAKWYKDHVGPLHRIKFHRIVLDEARRYPLDST